MNASRWTKHFVCAWEERSGDRRLPPWLRVASLAYAMHKANGHARFTTGTHAQVGDIALILGAVNASTGEVRPAERHQVVRAIDKAVALGWLAPGSNAGCLIVPGHAVSNGMGDPTERCSVNHIAASRKHVNGVVSHAS